MREVPAVSCSDTVEMALLLWNNKRQNGNVHLHGDMTVRLRTEGMRLRVSSYPSNREMDEKR